jgi:hypothetical protein
MRVTSTTISSNIMARLSSLTATYNRRRIYPQPTEGEEHIRGAGTAPTQRKRVKKSGGGGKAKGRQKKLVLRVTVDQGSFISRFRYNVEAILRHEPHEVNIPVFSIEMSMRLTPT